jgi:hypothetical protein
MANHGLVYSIARREWRVDGVPDAAAQLFQKRGFIIFGSLLVCVRHVGFSNSWGDARKNGVSRWRQYAAACVG